ncbi:MAG: ferric reductase-like transmembrane domain-containing protein [Acidobacteriota bacterium]
MSTTERFLDTPFAKRLVIVNGLVPAGLLVWDAYRHQLGVNSVNFAIHTTGLIGLVLLALSLVITPLRRLTGWDRLIAIRRNLGLLGFFYLVTHFAIFFLFDRAGSVSSTVREIVMRRYLWFGTGALVLMIPLAITSTDAMVVRLGAKRWKALQRLSYAVAIGALVHYYLLVKSDTRQPLAFAGVVALLFAYRLVAHYIGLRAEVRAARRRAAAAPAAMGPKKFWSGELTIAGIFDEAPDVKTFRLVSPDGGPLPFTHVAGQYLNLALTIDGKRVNRSYTIASPPTRNAYVEISVKRTADGYGSHHLHDTWREGQRVKVSAAAGRFVFAGHEADRVVLIAGGIGITPMMAVVRSLTDRAWHGEIYLLFSVRQVRDLVFRDELAYLQGRFPNLHARTTVSNDPATPWDGPRGQITRDVIAGFVPNLTRGPVLVCGPGPMMTAMREILIGMGVPDAEILQEAFVSPAGSSSATDAAADALSASVADEPLADGVMPTILFARTQKTAEMQPGQTVLEAAEAAGVDVPFECRSGICGQCKTPLLAGRVTMDVEDALTAADKLKGLILACQARAARDIEVDA